MHISCMWLVRGIVWMFFNLNDTLSCLCGFKNKARVCATWRSKSQVPSTPEASHLFYTSSVECKYAHIGFTEATKQNKKPARLHQSPVNWMLILFIFAVIYTPFPPCEWTGNRCKELFFPWIPPGAIVVNTDVWDRLCTCMWKGVDRI